MPAFLEHCKQDGVPVDFVTTHVYGNDTAKDGSGQNRRRQRSEFRVTRWCAGRCAMCMSRSWPSPYPQMPLIMSEYNASYANEPDVTDTVYMGPWLAETIQQCDGLTAGMSYWDFSDVFEEQGVTRTPFYGGFGLIAADEIPKPALHAFAMLHMLGERRIALDSDAALATRREDGTVVLALWNYAPPYGEGAAYTPPPAAAPAAKLFTVKLEGVRADAAITVRRLDGEHGNVLKTYDAMGDPPTRAGNRLWRCARPGSPQRRNLHLLRTGLFRCVFPRRGWRL